MKIPVSARAISANLATLLVNQANRELDASRMYMAMDLWFRFNDYPGAASWCRTHSEEERGHAMKIFDHLTLRETEQHCELSTGLLSDWSMKDVDANSISEIWKRALKQEQENSKHYFEMCQVAEQECDFVSREFLNWFVKEQLMEENAVEELVNKASKLEATGGLYMAMDKDMTKMDH